MWEALFWYVDIKIHHLIREKSVSHIRILPLYERNNTVGENEKIGKRFNWKRPTVEIEENTLILTCFPWKAYAKHYAALLHAYFVVHQLLCPLISYTLLSSEMILNSLQQTNLKYFPQQDTVVLGMVDHLSPLRDEATEREWEEDFLWKSEEYHWKKLLYFITFSKFKQMAIKKIIAFEVDHNRGKWSQIWLLSELAEVLGREVITRRGAIYREGSWKTIWDPKSSYWQKRMKDSPLCYFISWKLKHKYYTRVSFTFSYSRNES